MNVFVAYAPGYLRPETEKALKGVATFVALPDKFAYHRYWQERWAAGVKFISVEHDCAPTLLQLRELWDCREEWCSCGYHPQGDRIPFFGCVKFSRDFIRVHKEIWDVPPMDWTGLDTHLVAHKNVYFRPHLHGSVWHAKHQRLMATD